MVPQPESNQIMKTHVTVRSHGNNAHRTTVNIEKTGITIQFDSEHPGKQNSRLEFTPTEITDLLPILNRSVAEHFAPATSILNFNLIGNPQRVSENEVRGVIRGTIPVIITRYMNGWTAHLKVVVGGFMFHDFPANAADRIQFEQLSQKAWNAADRARDIEHNSTMEVAKADLLAKK